MGEASLADEPGRLPQVAEAMKAALGSVKGMSGTGTMSSRGFNKGAEIVLPAGADPQIRQAMDQMKESFSRLAAPLPEEAVGAGARWEVKMPVKSQGMTINQTATYELASIEGERVTAKCTLAQNASNQKIQNPTMPSLKVDLTKMVNKGTGNFRLDLAQLLPPEATLDMHSEMAMAMNMGGQKQTMTMTMDMNVQIEAK